LVYANKDAVRSSLQTDIVNAESSDMNHSLNRSSILLCLAAAFCSSLCAQDEYAVGQVSTDTLIQFSISPSGPKFLMHYIVTRCDTSGACCASHVQVKRLPDGQLIQDWSDTLSDEYPFVAFPDAPTFVDFNFDGYQDICFNCWSSSVRPPSTLAFFRQYNPLSDRFELAHQFDSLEGDISILDDKTIRTFAEMGSAGQAWIETNYKYLGSTLVITERVERRWEQEGFKIIIQRPIKGVLKTVSVRRD
jgi:hypothetical protein